MAVHVRFSDNGNLEDVAKEVLAWIHHKNPGRYLAAREVGKTGGRAHYHVWFETARTACCVRNNLNNNCALFKALGKNDKFVKEWGNDDKDLQYFVKEATRFTLVYRGFEWKQIEGLMEASKAYVMERKVDRAKRDPPAKQLYERCLAKHITKMSDIVDECLQVVAEQWKGVNDFAVMGWCKTAYMKLNGEEGAALVRERIIERMGIW